jgi:predicted nucleic acid-binding protein
MNSLVVDASIWVSRLVPQDEFHTRCKEWLAEQRSKGVLLISPSFLLVEVAGAISRRTGDDSLAEAAVQNLQRLAGLRLVEMDQVVIESATQMAASLGMRGGDAIYSAVARRLNLSLATLDSDQKDRASQMIKVEALL